MTIRRTPEDFVVEEVASADAPVDARPPPGARFAVYALTKSGWTTPSAAAALAKAAGLSPGAASYAGLKDRHAVTTQRVSLEFPTPGAAAGAPPSLAGENWSARLEGWSPREARASWIEGNRFAIVVRGLATETCDEMDRRAGLLRDDGGGLLIVNYFGDQRFGSARHGRGFAASALVRGDYLEAIRLLIATPARKDAGKTRVFTRLAAARWGDWAALARELPPLSQKRAIDALARGAEPREAFAALPRLTQTLAVEAFQSHLWNATARHLAWSLRDGQGRGVLRSGDTFGEMVFPEAARVPPAWRGLMVPLLGPATPLAEPWAGAARAALAEAGVEQAALHLPGLRTPFFGEAPRTLFVRAVDFEIEPPQEDDLAAARGRGAQRFKRRVGFTLSRGGYATVVLRALGQ